MSAGPWRCREGCGRGTPSTPAPPCQQHPHVVFLCSSYHVFMGVCAHACMCVRVCAHVCLRENNRSPPNPTPFPFQFRVARDPIPRGSLGVSRAFPGEGPRDTASSSPAQLPVSSGLTDALLSPTSARCQASPPHTPISQPPTSSLVRGPVGAIVSVHRGMNRQTGTWRFRALDLKTGRELEEREPRKGSTWFLGGI